MALKTRATITLPPEVLTWLRGTGNVSATISSLVQEKMRADSAPKLEDLDRRVKALEERMDPTRRTG